MKPSFSFLPFLVGLFFDPDPNIPDPIQRIHPHGLLKLKTVSAFTRKDHPFLEEKPVEFQVRPRSAPFSIGIGQLAFNCIGGPFAPGKSGMYKEIKIAERINAIIPQIEINVVSGSGIGNVHCECRGIRTHPNAVFQAFIFLKEPF